MKVYSDHIFKHKGAEYVKVITQIIIILMIDVIRFLSLSAYKFPNHQPFSFLSLPISQITSSSEMIEDALPPAASAD